ncbi:MAG TPA: hypothetical protein VD867_14655 [Burkholderiales bacterium]|nr:hypothetical protein [Burkholderiales bacterium]
MKHGASYISDPQGSLTIEAAQDVISEYRQGSASARFLICRSCGVLTAVVFDSALGCHGAMNARCVEGSVVLGEHEGISPSELDPEAKKKRWLSLWTPEVKFIGG